MRDTGGGEKGVGEEEDCVCVWGGGSSSSCCRTWPVSSCLPGNNLRGSQSRLRGRRGEAPPPQCVHLLLDPQQEHQQPTVMSNTHVCLPPTLRVKISRVTSFVTTQLLFVSHSVTTRRLKALLKVTRTQCDLL